MGIITWLIVGLIAGFLARAIMPGEDPMSVPQTLLLGLVGSVVGGLAVSFFRDKPFDFTYTGIIGSIIGAVVALFAYKQIKART